MCMVVVVVCIFKLYTRKSKGDKVGNYKEKVNTRNTTKLPEYN